MTTNDYKEKFIELFKEMEHELGSCASVEIEREDQVCYNGEIIHSNYKCKIIF